MLANNFCKPKNPKILPKANDIFAKLMVNIVKNKSLKDFMYFFVSKKIIKFISNKRIEKIITLVEITILEIRIVKKSRNMKAGSIG